MLQERAALALGFGVLGFRFVWARLRLRGADRRVRPHVIVFKFLTVALDGVVFCCIFIGHF